MPKAIEAICVDTQIATGATIADLTVTRQGSLTVKTDTGRGMPALMGYTGFGENMQRFLIRHTGWRSPVTNPINGMGFSPGSSGMGNPNNWFTPTPLAPINTITPGATQDSGGNEDENGILYILYPSYSRFGAGNPVELRALADGRIQGLPAGLLRIIPLSNTQTVDVFTAAPSVGVATLLSDRNYIVLGAYSRSATAGAARFIRVKSPDWPDEINPTWMGRGDVSIGHNWLKERIQPVSYLHQGSNELTVETFGSVNEATEILLALWEIGGGKS